MNELALFAGVGGGLLGTKLLGWRPVCAVEINEYRRNILLQRQDEGCLDPFPIWDDIRTFNGRPFCGHVDIITGGFPCQPYSATGRQFGKVDSRNLWPDTLRTIQAVRPGYCLLENVPGLLTFDYFGNILQELAACGYCIRYKILSARTIGANHNRPRLWIGAAHASVLGLEKAKPKTPTRKTLSEFTCDIWWATEPRICRVDDGDADWVERIRALGDAQVPGVVRAAWELLGLKS